MRLSIARLRQLAVESNLDPEFAQKVITFIVAEVVRHHEAIADESGDDSRVADAGEADVPGSGS